MGVRIERGHVASVLAHRARKIDRIVIKAGGARCMRAIEAILAPLNE